MVQVYKKYCLKYQCLQSNFGASRCRYNTYIRNMKIKVFLKINKHQATLNVQSLYIIIIYIHEHNAIILAVLYKLKFYAWRVENTNIGKNFMDVMFFFRVHHKTKSIFPENEICVKISGFFNLFFSDAFENFQEVFTPDPLQFQLDSFF